MWITIALISSKCFELQVGSAANTRSCLNQAQYLGFELQVGLASNTRSCLIQAQHKAFIHRKFFLGVPGSSTFGIQPHLFCPLLKQIFKQPLPENSRCFPPFSCRFPYDEKILENWLLPPFKATFWTPLFRVLTIYSKNCKTKPT